MRENTPVLLVFSVCDGEIILEKGGILSEKRQDWLQLLGVLAVPIAVALASILFGLQQANLADRQHATDQQNALDQQHATTLQTYIDNIQELLLKDNLFGDNPAPKNNIDKTTIQEVQELARARTLTALQGLDPDRKGRLVQFLWEAQLIGFQDDKLKLHNQIIDLSLADLSSANLSYAFLSGAFLSGANLRSANLSSAFLSFADLIGANLRGADLSGANFLTQQQLDQVSSCKDATLPTGVICHQTL